MIQARSGKCCARLGLAGLDAGAELGWAGLDAAAELGLAGLDAAAELVAGAALGLAGLDPIAGRPASCAGRHPISGKFLGTLMSRSGFALASVQALHRACHS